MAFNDKLQKLVVDAGRHETNVANFMNGMKAAILPAEVKQMINAQAELTKRVVDLLDDAVWKDF